MDLQTIIFYGRSGSGKGTQAKLLIEELKKIDPVRKTYSLETGSALRTLSEGDSHTASKVRNVLSTGGLMPEFLPTYIWTNFLIENVQGNEHLVFDGVARRELESEIINGALDFYNRKNRTVLIIDVSREWARERLLERGRSDDTDEDIKRRLDWYDTNVVPATQFFIDNQKYSVLKINGEQTIEEVHSDIIESLNIG